MKIAVTYDNGEVYQHFGRTQSFKIYEVENGQVVSSQVIGSDGAGHEALAGVLEDQGIDVLLCGGLGSGASAALEAAGIEVISGAEGSADAAVAAFLEGNLENAGVNCDHHEHEEEQEADEGGCGGSCGGNCGGGCSGCGGGCGGGEPQIILEGPNAGKIVKVNYRGTYNDGTQFDSSYDRGEPLEFICGAGMMIQGFDKAVVDMEVGQKVNIHLMPEEAYGPKDPTAIFTVKLSELPGAEDLNPGERVYLQNNRGQSFTCTVVARTEEDITFDANHEMAGKELNFEIELIEVK